MQDAPRDAPHSHSTLDSHSSDEFSAQSRKNSSNKYLIQQINPKRKNSTKKPQIICWNIWRELKKLQVGACTTPNVLNISDPKWHDIYIKKLEKKCS